MKQSNITWRLAELASFAYQERYVINGDAEEYVIAEELLENVEALKYRIDRPENAGLVNDIQRQSIHDLIAFISENSGDALSGQSHAEQAEIIRNSAVWKTLRAKAGHALSLFDLSSDMTLDDIDRLHASGQDVRA